MEGVKGGVVMRRLRSLLGLFLAMTSVAMLWAAQRGLPLSRTERMKNVVLLEPGEAAAAATEIPVLHLPAPRRRPSLPAPEAVAQLT